jgi:hypothetical protein
MRIAVAIFMLAATSLGCGVGRFVRPDQPLAVTNGDVLVAIDVEGPVIADLTFCDEALTERCFTTPDLSPGRLALFAVPPGRYCLRAVLPRYVAHSRIDTRRWRPIPRRGAQCFDTVPDAAIGPDHITYPGPVVLTPERRDRVPPQFGAIGGDVSARLVATYPALSRFVIEQVTVRKYPSLTR